MATLQTFTTPDEIRAVLGVAVEEISDTTLELPVNLIQLQFELSDINSALESAYTASVSILPASRTSAEQLLVNTVQVFSAYAVARSLLTSLATFAPIKITDGRAETGRSADPFESVREGVTATYESLKKRVSNAYQATLGGVGAVTSRTYFAAAGLSVNPVRNA